MARWIRRFAALAGAGLVAISGAEEASRLVRATDALAPAEENARLHAPAGFTVQLFASEPMINKPINMAFDARGRLWVSSTVEYPFAAAKDRWADDKGSRVKGSRDAIKILEDTDGDGRADKVTDFADGLNIPTGVLPWRKPEHKAGCIAFSIPNIWYFADTDGDDRADLREVLFGPLGYEKDTHGMCSSFRLGLDGWVYATHGFNNTSHFKARDGSSLDLHSGNVFRFRPDGSRVELHSAGQVNPFGLCWDRYGNLYSADCHSNPITQLIRGACYPSFGKPHDGLGFGPVMCEHSHGSTGLCGIIYMDGGVWGKEWDDHMFVGNCVTSKVNHDLITFTGSTPKANEQPDFITSDDPWFRPVDLQLGPDSALYIADFYNKIIGHYEVPLDHPGRDRERGRIWRVVKEGHTTPAPAISIESIESAVALSKSPNITVRQIAHQEMMTINGPKPLLIMESWDSVEPRQDYQWWYRESRRSRKEGIQYPSFSDLEPHGPVAIVMQLRQFVEFGPDNRFPQTEINDALLRSSPQVKRWCATALQTWPDLRSLRALIASLNSSAGSADFSLQHTIKLALREHLKLSGAFASLTDEQKPSVLDVAKAVPTAEAAKFLCDMWLQNRIEYPNAALAGVITRNAEAVTMERTITRSRDVFKSDEAVNAIKGIHEALLERGSPPPPAFLAWATELATSLLASPETRSSHWSYLAHPSHPADESPWCLQERKCTDGTTIKVISSLDHGKKSPEKLTGILRSASFAAPDKLSFFLCGHQGFPNTEANKKNLVRLVGEHNAVLHEAFPPRHNDAQRIEWDLSDIKGNPVRFEIVDGDSGTAYAWLGVGRFEQDVLSTDTFSSSDSRQRQLKILATILRTTAPVDLRDKLAAFLPKPPTVAKAKPLPEIEALMKRRIAAFRSGKPDAAKGEALFKANCAVCHSIKAQGGLIGPQLDGIGTRGVERLVEDILDPGRNVDAHFHLHQLKLRDGSAATGFVRGEVGQALLLVDAAGAEHRIAKGDVLEDQELPLSLMPPVFGQTLDEASFANLLGFLLNEKAGK